MSDPMPRCNDGSRRHSFAFTDATNTTLICTRCSRAKPVETTRTFRLPSKTVPGREYVVHAANGAATCSCRGWSTWKRCKHSAAVLKVLAEEKAASR